MPGVCRTRSLAYEGRKYASCHHRYAETVRHSLRNGFTAYSVLSLECRGLIASITAGFLRPA